MYNTLLRLYQNGKLSLLGLKNSVVKEWITVEQYQDITGEKYFA